MTGRRPTVPRTGGPGPEEETSFELVAEEGMPPPPPERPRRPRARPGQPVHGPAAQRGPPARRPPAQAPPVVEGRPRARPPSGNYPGRPDRLPRTWAPPGRPPRPPQRPPPRGFGPPPGYVRDPRGPPRSMPPRKQPFTTGTYIGLIGKLIYLIALFLPWYSLVVSVDSGDYATHGWVELVHIDGMRGVQINKLLTGGAIPGSLAFLPVPVSWLLLCVFIWSIISIFGARTARARGWKLVRGGIIIIIVFIVLYALISQLPAIIPDNAPNALRSLLDYIVTFPFGGDTTQVFGTYGTVHMRWGLQAGGFMLLVSAVVQLIGGFMEIGSGPKGGPAPPGGQWN